MRLHANFGGVVTPIKNNSTVVAAVGLEYSPARVVDLFFEISGESRVKWYTESFTVRSFDNDAFRLTPGIRLNSRSGLYLIMAGDFGVSERRDFLSTTWNLQGYRYATAAIPSYGAHLTLGWTRRLIEPDHDHDGLVDIHDRCPAAAEDMDSFEDGDGCPDPDNDADHLPDRFDACPNEPLALEGCPVRDSDDDGIKNDIDKCPSQAEDKDGFEDADGCPDLDNDADGVTDSSDRCVIVAEDRDEFGDDDGCPDPDNDADGIPDPQDKCPNHVGLAENNGCPKTVEIKRDPIILQGLTFKSGSAVIAPSSYASLDRVWESLVDWPEVNIEIQGYTDNRGSYESNRILSQKRADAVVQYLVDKGTSSFRLNAVGYGPENPIADNTSAEGRATNRRVEMRRVN
jgi:outer membrane protein OmpA-like peptidoglycan-associated protein